MKKVGIITFHNSYNCGSMLESFAIHHYLLKRGVDNEIINFSNKAQQRLYGIYERNHSWKDIIKNIILFPHRRRLKYNNECYQTFQQKNFKMTKKTSDSSELKDKDYSVVVAGSDQIWNVTIIDFDDAYFLPWVENAKKVAYAPSFGARNILKYAKDSQKYKKYLDDFDALSIRENNGKKWLKDLTGKEVEVLIDPTLLLEAKDYDLILDRKYEIPGQYIFFYCPSFNKDICKFVKQVADFYHLPVITWSSKKYYIHHIKRFGFTIPKYESPAVYLTLIKHASLVFTTSFHGTIFSSIYKKKFFTLRNGDMLKEDDRVLTLLTSLDLTDRLIDYQFHPNFNYLQEVNYKNYDKKLKELQKKAKHYITETIEKWAK